MASDAQLFSAVGVGSDPRGRRTRASPSFFSSTRVLVPSDCAPQMAAESTTTTSDIIRFTVGSVYRDAKSVNTRHNFVVVQFEFPQTGVASWTVGTGHEETVAEDHQRFGRRNFR
jgi:hypothetical protein